MSFPLRKIVFPPSMSALIAFATMIGCSTPQGICVTNLSNPTLRKNAISSLVGWQLRKMHQW
jgi:hypothetical protein